MKNLFESCTRIVQSIVSFQIEFATELAKQKMKILPFAQPTPRGDIFQDIHRKISHHSLWKGFEQEKFILLTCSFQSLSCILTARKSTTSRNYRRKAMLVHFQPLYGESLASISCDGSSQKEGDSKQMISTFTGTSIQSVQHNFPLQTNQIVLYQTCL